MSLMTRGLLVAIGIIVGTTAIDYFVLGNTSDYHLPSSRLGSWRLAKVRPACFAALEQPEYDPARPKPPDSPNRIAPMDYRRMLDMTAALHCYLVTEGDAVCEPNNRAYVVDYIGKYFQKMDEMLVIGARYGDAEIKNVRALWRGENNLAIDRALESHIQAGHLKRSDFGWSAPEQMKPLFERYPSANDGCAGKPAWVAVHPHIWPKQL